MLGIAESGRQAEVFNLIQRATFTLVFFTGFLLLAASGRTAGAQSEAEATPTPQSETEAAPAPQSRLTVQGENIASIGTVDASARNPYLENLHDGDITTMWTAQAFAPQWLSIEFDEFHLVSKVELVVTQSEAGLTTHELWLGDDSHTTTPYKRFDNLHTEDGQVLEVIVDPPRRINRVYILTRQSKGWVGWFEVRVFNAIEFSEWELNEAASGFELPVQATHAGDGSGRLFAVEQAGRIRILRKDAASSGGAAWSVDGTPFLDISERVSCCGERGLFDIAFPPDYAAKQHFYVSYTNYDGQTVISRYRATSDPDMADPASGEAILKIEQPHETHNGGRILFGPQDGYLYIGSGDGGAPAFNDPDNHGQDPSTLLGTILRIDVESGVEPYAIPASNPFTHVEDYRDEIWAYGLRNPWGFAFDRQTGALFIPDVGNITLEEVNYQPATSTGGENYGWRITEGSACFEQWGCVKGEPCDVEHWICSAEGQTAPVAEYDHALGCAIVGGAVYRGPGLPQLQGVFLFADFCRGQIWGLRGGSQDKWHSSLLIKASLPVSAIGEDQDGNVYVIGYQDGVISMITKE
jgi:glucose/arabinose dehydrogenase